MTDRRSTTQAGSESGDVETSLARPEFDAVFTQHFSYVFYSLRRLGVRERELEDVTHDVFVVVHRKLVDFDVSRPIKPWLFGIAYRVAADHRRLARHRREVLDSKREAVEPGKSADEALEQREARQLVLEALESLEPDQRAVFVMHEIDGHSMPEIVESLGIPLNTGYSRLRLARKAFATAAKRLRAQRGSS